MSPSLNMGSVKALPLRKRHLYQSGDSLANSSGGLNTSSGSIPATPPSMNNSGSTPLSLHGSTSPPFGGKHTPPASGSGMEPSSASITDPTSSPMLDIDGDDDVPPPPHPISLAATSPRSTSPLSSPTHTTTSHTILPPRKKHIGSNQGDLLPSPPSSTTTTSAVPTLSKQQQILQQHKQQQQQLRDLDPSPLHHNGSSRGASTPPTSTTATPTGGGHTPAKTGSAARPPAAPVSLASLPSAQPRTRTVPAAAPATTAPAPAAASRQKKKASSATTAKEASAPLYCMCRRPWDPENDLFMICCDGCDEWYHGECVGISEKEGKKMKTYTCPKCIKKRGGVIPASTDSSHHTTIPAHSSKPATTPRAANGGGLSSPSPLSSPIPVFASGSHPSTAPASSLNTSGPKYKKVREMYAHEAHSTAPPASTPSVISTTHPSSSSSSTTPSTVSSSSSSSSSSTSSLNTSGGGGVDGSDSKRCAYKNCNNMAKPGSKYCCDACGVLVARELLRQNKTAGTAPTSPQFGSPRLFGNLPSRLNLGGSSASAAFISSPASSSAPTVPSLPAAPNPSLEQEGVSAADQEDWRLIDDCVQKREAIVGKIRLIEAEHMRLMKDIELARTLEVQSSPSSVTSPPPEGGGEGDASSSTTTASTSASSSTGSLSADTVPVVDCASCGQSVPSLKYTVHLEKCLKRGGSVVAKKGKRQDLNRVCGCPTADFESGHCELLRKDCVKHINWEELRSATLVQEKTQLERMHATLDAEERVIRMRLQRRSRDTGSEVNTTTIET
eukprot:TRINITY_DN4075_c0_g1_i4.p1 TRINITY_DN4075_c0_g1~~TRINITY_DN4075_c0_g1_i4.p1  ORF type:complete len:880 (+),score=286.66 TRINITY_DN4075_c0_g1_i4:290-2641(+)